MIDRLVRETRRGRAGEAEWWGMCVWVCGGQVRGACCVAFHSQLPAILWHSACCRICPGLCLLGLCPLGLHVM